MLSTDTFYGMCFLELQENCVIYTNSYTFFPQQATSRSSRPEVLLGIGELKTRSKFTGEHLYGSVISIKLLCNFIEITLRHGCSLVNLLHIFRTPHLFLRALQDGWFCTSIDRLIGEKHIITKNTQKYCIILYYAVLSDDNPKVIFVQDSLKVI